MSRMFVPGPVDVADEVLQAQAAPMLPHRSKEFEAIFRRTSEKSQATLLYQITASFSPPHLELDCRKLPFAILWISVSFPLSTARLRIAGTRSPYRMERMR